MAESIVAIIPARSGSKSVPRKNIKLLAGKPLIAYSILEAKKCQYLDRIIVSTDDLEIASVAKEYGAEVPFLRPKEIAKDDTPDLPVFQHAIEWIEKNNGSNPQIIVHLRPTSPLRRAQHIDAGIRLLRENREADSVRAVCVPSQTPFKMWHIVNGFMEPLLCTEIPEAYNIPRQYLPKVYWQTGSVDVVRAATIRKKNSMTGGKILPLIVEEIYSIDVDNDFDFVIVEALIAELERRKL